METEVASSPACTTQGTFTSTPETAAIAMAEHLRAAHAIRLNGTSVEAVLTKPVCQGIHDKIEVSFYPDHTIVHRFYTDKSEQGTGEDLHYTARVPGTLSPLSLVPLLQALDAARFGMNRPNIY